MRKNGSTDWITAIVVQVSRKITMAKTNGRLREKDRVTTTATGTRKPAYRMKSVMIVRTPSPGHTRGST